MAWEFRGSHQFYYRKRRHGRRVVKTYVGGGEAGRRAPEADRRRQAERRAARHALKAEFDACAEVDRTLAAWSKLVKALADAAMLAAIASSSRGAALHHAHRRRVVR